MKRTIAIVGAGSGIGKAIAESRYAGLSRSGTYTHFARLSKVFN